MICVVHFCSGVKDSIIVHLRGDWVEAESAVIRDRVHKSLTKPFILIKHLKLGRPTFTGLLSNLIGICIDVIYI